MDMLEATAQLERIELLAKIAHASDCNTKEKTIALVWIGEIVEGMRVEIKNPQSGGISRGGCGFK